MLQGRPGAPGGHRQPWLMPQIIITPQHWCHTQPRFAAWDNNVTLHHHRTSSRRPRPCVNNSCVIYPQRPSGAYKSMGLLHLASVPLASGRGLGFERWDIVCQASQTTLPLVALALLYRVTIRDTDAERIPVLRNSKSAACQRMPN